jgi:hypothetical protein
MKEGCNKMMKCVNFDLVVLLGKYLSWNKIFTYANNLFYIHEFKNFLDYGLRRLMCELIHDNINMFIVKMRNYMSKLEGEGIPCSTKRKNNERNICMMNTLRETK